jgi:hypothetical protein
MGWSYFGTYRTAVIELGNVDQTLTRIQHSSRQEDPDYLPGDGLELAKFLSRCCQHSKILNVGAGEGSHPFSILRHFDDVVFDRETGRPYSPRLDILVNFPGVFASVDDFLAYYQVKGYNYLLVDPWSYSYLFEYPYLQAIETPEYQHVFEKIYTSKTGTTVYRIHYVERQR